MRRMQCGVPQERQPSGRGPPFVPGGFHGLTHQPEPPLPDLRAAGGSSRGQGVEFEGGFFSELCFKNSSF